jgi:hypothetical protein
MCVACGQELCKQCKWCHNSECERYTEPTEECEIDNKNFWSILLWLCSCIQRLPERLNPDRCRWFPHSDGSMLPRAAVVRTCSVRVSLSVREHLKKAPLEQGHIFASGDLDGCASASRECCHRCLWRRHCVERWPISMTSYGSPRVLTNVFAHCHIAPEE